MPIIVPPFGPSPSPVLLIGEAPGHEESIYKPHPRPFVGKAGREQDAHLSRHGLSTRSWRLANVIPEYIEGNPDPTPELIAKYTPQLIKEVFTCNPSLIICVGRFAARFFLGDDVDMDMCHGRPHRAGFADPTRSNRAPKDCTILPITHPAAGFYRDEARTDIRLDYANVANILSLIKSNKAITYREDSYAGKEDYRDVTGSELSSILLSSLPSILSLDTEGVPGNPWSLQVSLSPGSGYLLRYIQPDFHLAISALQYLADIHRTLFILHDASTPTGCGYDTRLCREMGLELRYARQWNTMYAAYLLRTEPKSLKALGYRWPGAKSEDYESIVGDIGRGKQIRYLCNVLSLNLDKPQPYIKHENDGTSHLYKPQHLHKTVGRILSDIDCRKVNKDGEPTNPFKRWRELDKYVRYPAESILGPMPEGSLADLPLHRATFYACRDSDLTLRLYPILRSELLFRSKLSGHDYLPLMEDGNLILPTFEEMQSTGMPAVKSHFIALQSELQSKMDIIQSRISSDYYGGKPFNPKSPQQVNSLMRRRGLVGTQRTSTGAISTSKQSIEYLRFEDDAISDVFDWRELQHIRDSFCVDVLARIPEDEDIWNIHCAIDPAKVHTRRLATSNPNFLATPVRTEIGKRIRDGYQVQEGRVFASWDYSQIEARVLAHISNDPILCRLFNESRDIHIETAAMIFDRTIEQVKEESDLRKAAKTINYGIFYGQGPSGLATQLLMKGLHGWDKNKCRSTLNKWFKVYSGVKRFADQVAVQCKRDECVWDLWNMPRYLPAINNQDPQLSAEAAREAVSHIISGTAQGMIQKAIIYLAPIIAKMQAEGLDILWHLEIHDEILMSFAENLWDIMNDLVINALVNHCGIKLRVPVLAEGHCARSWGELKD